MAKSNQLPDINTLQDIDISILRKTFKEGEKHMKYYYSTMSAFSNPENRVKCFDTEYYERVLSEIAKLLTEYDKRPKIDKRRTRSS